MFILFVVKLLAAISISLGVFTDGNVQPGETFHIVANVAARQSQVIHSTVVLSSSLELVRLYTSPASTCVENACVSGVDSSGNVLVIAFIRAKQKAPIGLQSIQFSAFDNVGNSASTIKSGCVPTKTDLILHRKIYFPIARR